MIKMRRSNIFSRNPKAKFAFVPKIPQMEYQSNLAVAEPDGRTVSKIIAAPSHFIIDPPASPSTSSIGRVLISPLSRLIDLTSVIVPLLVLVAAFVFLWGHGMGWGQLSIYMAMYLFTGFGVTVGFHRLFTHRAFETPKWVRYAMAIMGSMCVQGPLLWWVAVHRRHHQYSDDQGDPHSPHIHDGNMFGRVAAAFHSHVGWVFKPDSPTLASYVPDLLKDRILTRISDLYPLWVGLSLAVPALLGGLITHSWMGALLGLIWGGIIRVLMVHHITWSVNSICHLWGSQPFRTHDQSRNNWIVGILALGEGWHNNHHAFPTSATHGLGWRQPDTSYWIIRGMELLGLASRVRVPAEKTMAAKRCEVDGE